MPDNLNLKNLLPAFALFAILLSFSAHSQSVTISGRIIDGTSKELLPYATVILKTQGDSTMVEGTITDELGNFRITNVNPGMYYLETSFVGFIPKFTEVFTGKLNQYLDLGTITLEQNEFTLDEIIVQGERTTLSEALDRKTYGVDENLAQSGGSVLDAMRALPGVTIDQEGKIILRGSDRVTVLIDGNQSALTGYGNQKGLNNIPAANIDRIEIINNPSAKYNAAGMAGIVNIIYKKERDLGIHGEAGISLGLGAVTKRKDDLPTDLGSFSANPKVLPNLNLNYNTEKVNYFLQSSILFQEGLPNNEFTTRYYDDQRVIASQVPENRRQTHYIINGGLDLNPDESNSITLSGIYDYEIHVDTAQVPFIDLQTNTRERFYSWNEEEITGYGNITLNYKHLFPQPGHSISGTIQYTKGWEDESYFLQDSSYVRQSGDTTMLLAEEYTTNFNIDYVKPLKYGRFETGSRLQWRRIPVEYIVGRGENSIIYDGLSDWSKWGENIYSGYLNLVIERPGYDIEGGLRAEYTDVFYNIPDENIYYSQNDAYSYFELFPNIWI